MGFQTIHLKLPTSCTEEDIRKTISKMLRIGNFSYRIDQQSLDARKKDHIHWEMSIVVNSPEIKGGIDKREEEIRIPKTGKGRKAIVTGSGPAGFFSASILQKAGYMVTILERGKDVDSRAEGISSFESGAAFDPAANYAFGEGGAGTFSDGKLTSRSKRISAERNFIIESYIAAGAPSEIAYMNHPHLGSDNLRKMVKNLRSDFCSKGGIILFQTLVTGINRKNGMVQAVETTAGEMEADVVVFATGHSAYETFRMLISHGVQFRPKNFALGSRMEHPRRLINKAQWGREELPGVKAAEYRLTSNPPGLLPVYSFCMCPGGVVVPSTAYAGNSIVNGMSYYKRDLPFSNAACVAAFNPFQMIDEQISALRLIDWLEELETSFFAVTGDYRAPSCSIRDFLSMKTPSSSPASSYPLGLFPYPVWELLPAETHKSMREGLKDFCRKMRGFEEGTILGLESKTSAALQVLREEDGTCSGFKNLYICGEGSGYAGGIVSSAADGVKTALKICGNRN